MRKKLKKQIALIDASMLKITINQIVEKFQRTNDTSEYEYLINIIKILSIDMTLIAIKRLIILKSKWFVNDQSQTIKRIHRIDQIDKIISYLFLNSVSNFEMTIFNRQRRRVTLNEDMTLNAESFDTNDLVKNVDEDSEYENSNIKLVEKIITIELSKVTI